MFYCKKRTVELRHWRVAQLECLENVSLLALSWSYVRDRVTLYPCARHFIDLFTGLLLWTRTLAHPRDITAYLRGGTGKGFAPLGGLIVYDEDMWLTAYLMKHTGEEDLLLTLNEALGGIILFCCNHRFPRFIFSVNYSHCSQFYTEFNAKVHTR